MNGKRAGLMAAGAIGLMVLTTVPALAQDDAATGSTCTFTGGDAAAASVISGDSPVNGVLQAPVGGNAVLNSLNCSDFLNGNGNGNGSGNSLTVLEPGTPPVVDPPQPPVDPTDPSNPTGPTNPTDPSNPTGPTNPTDPSNPTGPTNPTDPSNPTGPTNPIDPKAPTS